MIRFSSCDQRSSSDLEESGPLQSDKGIPAAENPETTNQVDHPTSDPYEATMASLDLPDQEESPIPFDIFFLEELEAPADAEPQACEERTAGLSGPAREPSTLEDAPHPPDSRAYILHGSFQEQPQKAVNFSKLGPEMVAAKESISSQDSAENAREERTAAVSQGTKYEVALPSSSPSSSRKQLESSTSGLVEGVQKQKLGTAFYQTVPDRIIRFSSLKTDLISQQRPFQMESYDPRREDGLDSEAGHELEAGKRADSLEAALPFTGHGEIPIFMESDTFRPLDHSPGEAQKPSQATELYQSAIAFLTDAFADISEGKPISIDRAYSIMLGIANSSVTRDEWSRMLDDISYPSDSKDFLLFHQANVAIYSICLGITLQLGKEELCRLGIIGLLHDIGKMLIPDEILFKRGQLTPEEWKVLKQYPYESYKILSTLGPRYDILAQCSLQVNERIDGTGSPRGLKGETIHCHAQIIGLMDVYEAMTSNRPYRPKLIHYDAVKEILKTRKASFSRSYITALLKTFSIFPLYSCVKLNSGVIGKIIAVNKELPMRPKIEIIYDAGGVHLPIPFVVDLATQSFLYIEAPIPERDLPADPGPGEEYIVSMEAS